MYKRLGVFFAATLAACAGELKAPEGAKQDRLIADAYEGDVIRVTGAVYAYADKPIVAAALCALAPLARQKGYVGIRFNGGDNHAMAFSGGAEYGYIYSQPSLFFSGMKLAPSAGARGLQGAPFSPARTTQPVWGSNGATLTEQYDSSPEIFDLSRVEFDCGQKVSAKNNGA